MPLHTLIIARVSIECYQVYDRGHEVLYLLSFAPACQTQTRSIHLYRDPSKQQTTFPRHRKK